MLSSLLPLWKYWLTFLTGLPIAVAADSVSPKSPPNCEEAWARLALANGIELRGTSGPLLDRVPLGSIGWRSDSYGRQVFFARRRGAPPVFASTVVSRTHFPYPEFLGEDWNLNGQRFRLMNIGTHPTLADSEILEDAFLKTQSATSEFQSAELTMSAERGNALKILGGFRNATEVKVIDVYRERKGKYLPFEALRKLSFIDQGFAKDFDLLVLLRDTGKDPLKMSKQEFEDSLAATIRLARFGATDPLLPPSINRLLEALAKEIPFEGLPHSYRLNEGFKKSADVLTAFKDQSGKRVAEITRFVRFQEFSSEIMQGFIKTLFDVAAGPKEPIDFLLISVDSHTRKLFRRYGFEDFATITTGQEVEQEYLMILDTRSERFKEIQDKLSRESAAIVRTPVEVKPKISEWSPPWQLSNPYLLPENVSLPK
ncbi:MAG: hypothetical protein NDJ89_18835 [Oligoflexia bacterium]|nr:hypothetical protein [Oligoflexia bacterium]